MTTLEKIREEIAKIEPLDYPCDKRTPRHMLDMALEIIDRYAEEAREDMTIAYLMGYYEDKETCEDAVSRQAVLDRREVLRDEQGTGHQAVKTKYIRELPSVQPMQKTGTWSVDIDHSRGWDWRRFYCSECGGWQTYGEPKFCPKCGSRMEVDEK